MNDWHDAEQRFERALEWVQQRKWQQALAELRAATSINPFNAAWFFKLGLILDEMGRFDEALDAYRKADEIEPNNLQVLERLGIDLHRIGKSRAALATFAAMAEIDPAHEAAYCQRVLIHAELGEHDIAEELFYTARLYKDHCPRCYDHMGRSLLSRNLNDKAIYCFQKCLDLDKGWNGASARLADAYWNKGDLEQARWHYLADLRQSPGGIQTLMDLGDLLLEMGRVEEAGEKFRRCIELAPNFAPGYMRHGRWLSRCHKSDEARTAFAQAIRLDPTLGGVHLELARLGLRHGNAAAAREHLRAEHFLHCDDVKVLLGLANAWMDCSEFRTAIACLKRLLDRHPHNADAWLNLGVAQFRRGMYAQGIASCRQALELDAKCRLAMYNLALAHDRLGQYEIALHWTRQALDMEPRDVTLGRLETRLRMLSWIESSLTRIRRGFDLVFNHRRAR